MTDGSGAAKSNAANTAYRSLRLSISLAAMPEPRFPPIALSRKSGSERFHASGEPMAADVREFWSWACSDLTGNSLRGLVAEYLVALAVGSDAGVRVEWDECDVRTPTGLRIEVKTSAYLQSWAQDKLSQIAFDIAPKRSWQAATNVYSPEPQRSSDVYVFAVHKHQTQETLDPLDVSQWDFYVVPTGILNARFPSQKSIRLSVLKQLGIGAVPYGDLAAVVRLAASLSTGIVP